MSNILFSDPAINRELIDGWQSIVDLLADILALPHVTILFHQNFQRETMITNQPYAEYSGLKPLSYALIKDAQQKLNTPPLHNEWVEGEYKAYGTTIWYWAIPLNVTTNDSVSGWLFVADRRSRHLTNSQHKLLVSYQKMIETQLVAQKHALEITQLKSLTPTTEPNLDYQSLAETLSQERVKRKTAENQLHYHKISDLGTGFLNRAALEEQLEAKYDDNDDPTSCFLIHIGFHNSRTLQSRYGCKVWDAILLQYRARIGDNDQISATARPNSTDLCFLMKDNLSMNQIESLCQHLLSANRSPFYYEDQPIYLHSYLGIAATSDAHSALEWLDHTSSAMVASKTSGSDYCFHSQIVSESQSRTLQLENYLLHAVRNGDFMLYFQPKVVPTNQSWSGAEALLRWRHPILGEISTETLIQLAEKNGLINEVGHFVLKKAIEKASLWSKYVDEFKMAVNISAKQLKDVRFIEQVVELLQEYDLPPQYLEIEITESGLITDEKVASDILHQLHAIGITLSLDDFGTGYASFNYLKKFPFDCIKIDKSFIHPLEHSTDDKEIVRSIIQVAKKLNLKVIIEGVETEAQEAFVMEEGCDYGQGFLYGRPMPEEDFETRLLQQSLTN